MKSAVAAVGAFAALANAYSPNHLHFPRGNATTTAEPLTTLTVLATHVSTIISCHPTVTNCPAGKTGMSTVPESDRSTAVVTHTVLLTSTVCPLSSAPHISASVISDHSSGLITGSTITTAVVPTNPASNTAQETGKPPASVTQTQGPSSTQGPSGVESSNVPQSSNVPESSTDTQSYSTTTTDIVTVVPVTTTGTGSEGTVGVTRVTSTIKQTITVPCTQTNTNTEEGPTSTTTATSTSTRTITVSKVQPTSSAPATGTAPGTPGSTGESCPKGDTQTVTVTEAVKTVTIPASTVYVTQGDCEATKTGAVDQPTVTDKAVNNGGSGNNGSGNNGSGNNGNGAKSSSEEPCTDETTTLQATVTVVPYPVTNGTAPKTTGGAKPSGFARLRR